MLFFLLAGARGCVALFTVVGLVHPHGGHDEKDLDEDRAERAPPATPATVL